MATYHTPAVNFQASYVENLHDTAKMLIFAALLCRPPAPPWACTHKKLLGWWNGRHEGLKILWPLRLCGFKSRSEYKTIAGYLVAGDFLFLPQKTLAWPSPRTGISHSRGRCHLFHGQGVACRLSAAFGKAISFAVPWPLSVQGRLHTDFQDNCRP